MLSILALGEELSRPVYGLQENTDGKGLNFCPELELSVWKIPAEMACVRGLSSSDFLQRKKKSKSLELIDLCAQGLLGCAARLDKCSCVPENRLCRCKIHT